MSKRNSPGRKRRAARRAAERMAPKPIATPESATPILPPSSPNIKQQEQNRDDPPNQPGHTEKENKLVKYFARASLLPFIWGLFGIASNGFYGFFADEPGILLWPFGMSVCVLIVVGTHQLVVRFKFNKLAYVLPILLSVKIGCIVFNAVNDRKVQLGMAIAERKEEQKAIAAIPQSVSATREEIKALMETNYANLKGIMNSKNVNDSDDREFPGLSVHAVLRLNGVIPNRRNYIFDLGELPTSNRMSLYLQPDETLCLRIIDRDGNSYSTTVIRGLNTFTLHSLLYVICDCGISGNDSFLRIIINGNVVAYQRYPGLGNFHTMIDTMKWQIGTDLDGKNGSPVTFETYVLAKVVFDRQQRSNILNALDNFFRAAKPNEGGVTSKGDGVWEYHPELFTIPK